MSRRNQNFQTFTEQKYLNISMYEMFSKSAVNLFPHICSFVNLYHFDVCRLCLIYHQKHDTIQEKNLYSLTHAQFNSLYLSFQCSMF